MLKLQNCFQSGQYIGRSFRRWHSTASPSQKLKESNCNKEDFKDLMARRQSEALRSIMLEVNTKDICGQVYNYCKQFGEIKNAFVYTRKNERNLMLLEYDDVDAVNETFKFSGFQSNTVQWPNRFLAIRNAKLDPSLSIDAPLQFESETRPSIEHILRNVSTFDEQANLLYEHTKLTDLSVRFKFLTALQAQIVISEYLEDIFPHAKVYPFGSSLNGFGKEGCDLDMVLYFNRNIDITDENTNVPLAFQGKQCESAEEIKKLSGCQVRCIASMIDYLLPGTEDVTPIGHARVPIVRYNDSNINNSVDLSVNNMDSFHITEYMYAMGLMDERIRPFIYMVRQWYKNFETDRYIGHDNFSNFQLSYICLSFLQHLKEPLIPTYGEIIKQITAHQSDSIENILKNPFIFNFDRFHFETKNTTTILELFVQFLTFVEAYDFDKYIMTVRTIEKIPKPEPDSEPTPSNQLQKPKILRPLACYMENIFDSKNAWGGNVSDPECSTLKITAKKTLNMLEQCAKKSSDKDWGLLEIVKKLK